MPNCVERGLIENAELIVAALRQRGLSAVTAESCTAGLVAALLSHIPHAGECLHGGYVAYSKQQKITALGVDEALLKTHGSVNAEVVLQMALGALTRSHADVSVAVTGVLGPDPDEDGNPAGLVYFAAGRRDIEPLQVSHRFECGSPDEVRYSAAETALELLLRIASA